LAISRAFGDFDCKNIEMPPEATEAGGAGENGDEKIIRNFIMSEPEIRVIDIDP